MTCPHKYAGPDDKKPGSTVTIPRKAFDAMITASCIACEVLKYNSWNATEKRLRKAIEDALKGKMG